MVSNHQSLMDILILFRTFFHFKWVSKASMFKAPLLGWNMKLNGYVPIHRGDPNSREKCLNLCKSWLKKGSSVFFFPEGTRFEDGTMAPFKLGAFRLALETGTDILPMVIVGSEKAVPKNSILLTKKSKMEVRILPPISTQGYDLSRLQEEAARLAEHVHQVIRTALGRGHSVLSRPDSIPLVQPSQIPIGLSLEKF
jgi:1-acyl-sn-glycerol-3-phosphate acyltransferase